MAVTRGGLIGVLRRPEYGGWEFSNLPAPTVGIWDERDGHRYELRSDRQILRFTKDGAEIGWTSKENSDETAAAWFWDCYRYARTR